MNIVFMGTPDFSVPCLERLIADSHNVSGVFTQPDKPKGRGHKLQFPPVKEVAIKNNIPVFQPLKMRDGEAMSILSKLNPELIIVVAYGKILPEEIINFPKYGCVNIHASLLPRYRGAAPIQWCVLNGEKKSGVTSMQMDVGLDTGDMILTREVEIDNNETSGDLFNKLSEIGADVMSETIQMIIDGKINPVKQNDADSNYAPMLTKELCPIDWNLDALSVHNKVRGLYPFMTATSELNGKRYKIHKTLISSKACGKAGEIIEADKHLIVACGDGNGVEILTIQSEGKKAMNTADFMRGNSIEVGDFFK